MKVAYGIMVFMLIGALVLPFFMKDADDKPIMTVDKLVGDAVADIVPAAPVEMFRWQDEHGIWQFGENPPEQVTAAKVSLDDSRTTSMGAEWDLREPSVRSGQSSSTPVNFQMPNSLSDAYRAAPELMGAAQRAADSISSRTGDMAGMLENTDHSAK